MANLHHSCSTSKISASALLLFLLEEFQDEEDVASCYEKEGFINTSMASGYKLNLLSRQHVHAECGNLLAKAC